MDVVWHNMETVGATVTIIISIYFDSAYPCRLELLKISHILKWNRTKAINTIELALQCHGSGGHQCLGKMIPASKRNIWHNHLNDSHHPKFLEAHCYTRLDLHAGTCLLASETLAAVE